MNVCIMGSGASGWIASTMLKKLDFIKKITIIGSSKIPSIGVGESTTLNFVSQVLNGVELKKFVRESDASVKYGVYYKNWSKKDFIHYFKSQKDFFRKNTDELSWGQLLANKDPNIHIHELIGAKLWNFIHNNEVSLDTEEHAHSWHFDAGKFINFLKKINLQDNKVNFIDDTIVNCKFSARDEIKYITGESKTRYIFDYYINCCGDYKLNEKIFKEKYISLSRYLLTNKALVYPLNYKDKAKEFHPYTMAKTMKNGWRWITPTQSRIGTGYVFSDKYVSVDEATSEFIEDIGDKTVNPILVNFNPRYNKKPFKSNNCTIGMSAGFLEPLDAPGLSITILSILDLCNLLNCKKEETEIAEFYYEKRLLNEANNNFFSRYYWWCSFILHQYKTCWRNDTKFWIHHKNIKCDFYNELINSFKYNSLKNLNDEYMMFFLTTASKDIQWNSKIKQKPFPIEQFNTKTIHHLDYIQSFYD